MDEWQPLRQRLRETLTAMAGSSGFLQDGGVQLVTAGEETISPKKHWWQHDVVERSPRYHRVRFLRYDSGEYAADLTGTTLIGGHHDVTETVHEHVKSFGWLEPGEQGFIHKAGGVFEAHVDADGVDQLIETVIGGLQALGAQPDQDWILEPVR